MNGVGYILDYEIPRSLMHRRDIPEGLEIEGRETPGRAIRRCMRVLSERRRKQVRRRRLVKRKVRAMGACEVEGQVGNKDEQEQYQDDHRLGLGRERGRLEKRILQDALAQRRFGRV